ncbi:Protein N-acetyltransferase, RimJ/RimL family [Hymenobacter gelipurpurascens]|uniref:Protein N-acetyltransferase, RimJ/RimL family n=1 Tax=Hymenobacter gelipurpurascens TaxID=89968 RepID=A0A212UAK7_9BACT|nr:GNAT family protein [Hymenobacter gelipurpurascens]SNC75318.1 Protein N-acetyltransferase, RimJ/RimL family [Hymenobacter gelipurpurascens]
MSLPDVSPELLLTTRRLHLRTWRAPDALPLHVLLQKNHERLRLNFPKTLAANRTLEDTASFIRERQREWQQRHAFQLGLWHPETQQLLGLVSLRNVAWEIPKAELAYLLDAEVEGQGLMQEALQEMLEWAFKEVGLTRIYCQLRPENRRSARLVQRAGFRHEGCFRQDYRGADGRLHDLDQYALLRADYLSLAPETT